MPRTTKPPPPTAHGPDALDRLRELVADDRRSINHIARDAGMARSQLSGVLCGVRRDPAISTIARILAALGRTWADLDSPALEQQ